MFKIDRYKVTGALWIVVIFFVGAYVLIPFDSSYREAKKYIEESRVITDTVGPVQYAFVLPFSRNKVFKASCGAEANYEFSIVGNEAAHVLIRLIPNGDSWVVQRANLITKDNRVIVLRDQPEDPTGACQK